MYACSNALLTGGGTTLRLMKACLACLRPPMALIGTPSSARSCARTVAWLEFLAGEALESEHQAPLASSDGVWADTRRRLDAAAASRGFAGRDAGEGGGRGIAKICRCCACLKWHLCSCASPSWPPAAVLVPTPHPHLLQPRPRLASSPTNRSRDGDRAGSGRPHPPAQAATGG